MSRVRFISVIGGSIFVAACAGAPPSNLVDARKAYQDASQSPARELAPDQLHAAQASLEIAERTYKDEGNSPNMSDRAYVAMRKSQLAEAHAGIVQANAELKTAEERKLSETQGAQVAVANELATTRAELETARGVNAAQKDQLEALKAAGEVKQEARGVVLTLSGSVIFPSGKAELLPSARSKLSEVASALSSSGDKSKISVEGHTDSAGSDSLNQELSLKRATAVRDALVSDGVSADRVSVQGYGETRPVADNASQAGRANNRRVEIVIQPAT